MEDPWAAFIGTLAGDLPTPASQFISFSGPLEEQQLQELYDVLAGASGVLGFRLAGCALGDAGAHILALALAGNKHLDSIELPDNDIGPTGANALGIMMESNKTIVSLALEGNPCEEEGPEIMQRIERCIERNRNLQRGPFKAEASPLAQQRARRTRARIMEISVDAGIGAADFESAHEGEADMMSARSEQFSTRSDPATALGDVAARLFDLERRQRQIEDLARKLEDDSEGMQLWQTSFQQQSEQAMTLFLQQKADIEKHRASLDELSGWREEVCMIMNSNSASTHRQHGDFHGLREKVMQLHSEFERVRRASTVAAAPAGVTTLAADAAQPTDGSTQIKTKIAELEAQQQEISFQLNTQLGELSKTMEHCEFQQAQHERTRTDFEGRIRSLEKVGEVQEEGPSTAELQRVLEELRSKMTARLQQLESISEGVARQAEADGRIDAAVRRADAVLAAKACLSEELTAVGSAHAQQQRALEEHARRLAALELSAADADQDLASLVAFRQRAGERLDSVAAEQDAAHGELAALTAATRAQGRQIDELLVQSRQALEQSAQEQRRLAELDGRSEEIASLANTAMQDVAALQRKVRELEAALAQQAAGVQAATAVAARVSELDSRLSSTMQQLEELSEHFESYAVQEKTNSGYRKIVNDRLSALDARVGDLDGIGTLQGRVEALEQLPSGIEPLTQLPSRVLALEQQLPSQINTLSQQLAALAALSVESGVFMAASAQGFPASFALLDIGEDYSSDESSPVAGPSTVPEPRSAQRSHAGSVHAWPNFEEDSD